MSLKVEVKDIAGKPTGTIDLPASIFDVQANVPLIHQVVVAQLELHVLELTKLKIVVRYPVVERNLSSKRELVVLVRVQLVHLTSVMVVLHMVQYLVSMTNAHQRK